MFRHVTPADLDLIQSWQAQPHVRQWWGDDSVTLDALNDGRVARWIISINGRAFAYMQDYTIRGWDDHPFYELPLGAKGIDQFIGAPDMVGQGHGPGFIGQRVKMLFEQGAPVVATDPHPKNARAIAAYQKAGFAAFGAPLDTPWGPILPMKVGRP